jgi:hypothetical protein
VEVLIRQLNILERGRFHHDKKGLGGKEKNKHEPIQLSVQIHVEGSQGNSLYSYQQKNETC